MNFKLTHPLPKKCIVAVSGGIDSIFALHFLNKIPGRVARVIHVNHASGAFAEEAEELVSKTCEKKKLDFTSRRIKEDREPGESRENHWREQRFRFFLDEFAVYDLPIVLGHNLDDCLEEYIMATMVRGFSGTIPYKHGPCIRPFRMLKRLDIEAYSRKHPELKWVEDPSNRDYTRFKRAFIRRLVVPRIRNLSPGVYNIVEKVIREQDLRDSEGSSPKISRDS